MNDGFDLAADATPPDRVGRRAVGQGFVEDLDRVYLYRVLSVHARAGIRPEEATVRIEEVLSRADADENPVATNRRERRRLGAERMGKAFERAAQGDPSVLLHDCFAKAGLSLTPEEAACLAIPAGAAERLPLLADALSALAVNLQDATRR